MKLAVNGESHEYAGPAILLELLKAMGAAPDRVAVMVNDRIVEAKRFGETPIREGDRVEILIFAGGG